VLFLFDSYVLDSERRELRHRDAIVSVQPQVFDLLEYLIRNRGRVVSRDDMLAAVWGGRIVSESTLATRINAMRRAIGDDGERQRLIRTLPRKGIRFVGDVRENDDSPQQSRAAASPSGAATDVVRRVEAERRQLTIMSCAFVGLRELAAQLDPEELSSILSLCQACCSQVADRWGGSLARFTDDGSTIHFSYPQAHEDDPERAVRAGLDLLERVARLEIGAGNCLSARIGVATGLVVVGGAGSAGIAQDGMAVGAPPTLAAALQRAAPPGAVLIAARTHGLLGGLFEAEEFGPLLLEGFSNPVPAWRVIRPSAVESRFEALRKTGLSPFFGRHQEIEHLLRRWREAKSGKGGVVLISGEPGIGKSRIVSQLADRLGNREQYTRLRYQCSPHHRDSALHPVIAHLERFAALRPDDPPERRLDKLEAAVTIPAPHRKSALPLLAAILAIPTTGRYPPLAMNPMQQRRQTLGALLDELEALARRRPALVVFEDAHWADPTSIELLDLMIERIRRLPVLALITFRPDFVTPWAGLPSASAFELERLSPRDARAIVERLSEGQALPAGVLEQIVAKTDGVPLFIEELTKNVLESQLTRLDTGAHRSNGALPPLSIPSTLEDTLRARIDRLSSVKDVAQVGAAVGRSFAYKIISAVISQDTEVLRAALDQLVDAKLIFRQAVPSDAVYTFKHALVQEAAYESLLRIHRVALHGRIAAVIESQFPEIVDAEPELLAHHYSRAELGEKAVGYLLKAGARAVSRSANLEAINHLRNGLQQLTAIPAEGERARLELELQLTLGQALIAARGYTAEETTLAFKRAEELVDSIGDVGQRYSALYGNFVGRLIAGHVDAASETIDRMYQLASTGGDDAYLCLAYRLRGSLSFFRGDLRAAREELKKAIALRDPASQQRLASHFGPDTGAAAEIFLAMTEWLRGMPGTAQQTAQSAITNARQLKNALTIGQVLTLAAQLHYMSQDYETMAALSKEGGENCERIGIRYFGAICQLYQIWAKAWRSRPADYIDEFRDSLKTYEGMGCGLQVGLFRIMLARLQLAADRPAEGAKEAKLALASFDANGERWWVPEVYRTLGDALLVAASPNEAEAQRCFARALSEARGTGALMLELRAAASLARLLVGRGDGAQAKRTLSPVLAQFRADFDSVDIRAARAILDGTPKAPSL
jgi:DNA-binding winged helix-turn-helix (wHTH) protein